MSSRGRPGHQVGHETLMSWSRCFVDECESLLGTHICRAPSRSPSSFASPHPNLDWTSSSKPKSYHTAPTSHPSPTSFSQTPALLPRTRYGRKTSSLCLPHPTHCTQLPHSMQPQSRDLEAPQTSARVSVCLALLPMPEPSRTIALHVCSDLPPHLRPPSRRRNNGNQQITMRCSQNCARHFLVHQHGVF